MAILNFVFDVFRSAFDGDYYAILILSLAFLLTVSFFRRSYSEGKNDELNGEIKKLGNQLNNLNEKLVSEESKLNDAQKIVITRNQELEQLENKQDELLAEIQELGRIRKNYSELYTRFYELEQAAKGKNRQVHRFHLSPHFLKNMLNNVFLGAKVSFSSDTKEDSFSIFGKRFHSIGGLKKIIEKHNKKLENSILLLVDTLNYLIYGIQAATVHIDTEIIQLEKFCKLIKDNKGIEININNKMKGSSLQLPPTILFNYIDNAVKHGYFGESNTIEVDLNFVNSRFEYKVASPFHKETKNTKGLGGLGNKEMTAALESYKGTEFRVWNEIHQNKYIANLQITL